MRGPESPASVEEGRQARWSRAFVEERAEASSGRVGPCHETGGVYHRCDSAPVWVSVSFGGKPYEPYHWCNRAVVETHQAANEASNSIVTRVGLCCPDCTGDPCNEGRELIPTYRLVNGAMVPDGGQDICEHDCHDHDRPEEEN